MPTQKAIQIQGPSKAQLVSNAPIPKLRDDYILVRPKAVALNPTDWKHIEFLPSKGAIVGCDYAGIVEKVGPNVTNGLKPGDRVAGAVHGSNADNHEDGAFADLIAAKGDLQIRIPNSLSFEEASTLSLGLMTVGQSLYRSLGLPTPSNPAKEKFPILIYGASTATGTLAVQFAKLSGLEVMTTSRPHNFPLLRSLGASHLFDYTLPTCAASIRTATSNKLAYTLDCIASPTTAALCCEAIGSEGGKYSSLLKVRSLPREDVENKNTLMYTLFGETFHKGANEYKASREEFEFGREFMKECEGLVGEGKVRAHPVDVREGGLEGVLEGLRELKAGGVSGRKLVYQLE